MTYYQKYKSEGRCGNCGGTPEPQKVHCGSCAANSRKNSLATRQRELDRLFAAYGERCSCCGETNRGFLTVDHVNSDGATHRRTLGGRIGGAALARIIRKEGYPMTYRILCYNCNCGRARNGGVCPHEGVS